VPGTCRPVPVGRLSWASQRDSQENPIGLTDGSFGFELRSVNRWLIRRRRLLGTADCNADASLGCKDAGFGCLAPRFGCGTSIWVRNEVWQTIYRWWTRSDTSRVVHDDTLSDPSQPDDQSLLCSLEIERKRIQGRDCCMYAQARDDIEPTCKIKSDMANKMSDAID